MISAKEVHNVRTQAMQTLQTLIILAFCFCLFSLSACGREGGNTRQETTSTRNAAEEALSVLIDDSQNPLMGTWTNGDCTLTFQADNTYSAVFNHGEVHEIRGTIVLSGNVLIITDFEGTSACTTSTNSQTASGCYTFTLNGNMLSFSLFHDPCGYRATFLGIAFTKR